MKKKMLALALAAVMCTAALAGCSSSSETSNEPAAEEQGETSSEYADQIIMVRNGESTNLDPVTATTEDDLLVTRMIYENLYDWTDEGDENVLEAAESIEVSDDNMVYTFKLRDDIYFSDGTKATADDWVFSFNRALTTEENQFRGNLECIEKVEALDESTLQITLNTPSVVFDSILTSISAQLMSKAHCEEVGIENLPTNPLGTGLYYVKEWVPGEYILFGINPYHRDADTVKYSELKMITVSDENTRSMMLINGEADIAWNCSTSQMALFESTDGVKANQDVALQMRYLMFNCVNAPTDDIRVREALRYATDLNEIVAVAANGYAEPASSFFGKGQFGFNESLEVPQQDIEKAKELLAEAGYENGFDIDFWVRSDNAEYQAIATTIKEQWAKAGINVNLTTMETAAILDAQYNLEQPIVIGRWSEDMNDPQGMASYFFSYDDTYSYFTGLKFEEGEELLAKAAVEADETARAEQLGRLQEIFYEEVPGIPLYYLDWFYGTSENLHDMIVTPEGAWRFEHMYKTVD